MDQKSASEELPALYRAVLDRIALLDGAGEHVVAYRIRVQATRIYSRAWDDRARRGLDALLRQASERETAEPALLRGSTRRSAPGA